MLYRGPTKGELVFVFLMLGLLLSFFFFLFSFPNQATKLKGINEKYICYLSFSRSAQLSAEADIYGHDVMVGVYVGV